MFTTKILKNIIKKPQLYQSRFQSIYFSYEDDKKVNLKINDNIQVQIKPYSIPLAFLCFVNEKSEPINIPKHMALKMITPIGEEIREEIARPEYWNGQECYSLEYYFDYDLLWKDNLILEIRDAQKQYFTLVKNIDLDRISIEQCKKED